jgi:hypothetical protein
MIALAKRLGEKAINTTLRYYAERKIEAEVKEKPTRKKE